MTSNKNQCNLYKETDQNSKEHSANKNKMEGTILRNPT